MCCDVEVDGSEMLHQPDRALVEEEEGVGYLFLAVSSLAEALCHQNCPEDLSSHLLCPKVQPCPEWEALVLGKVGEDHALDDRRQT